MNSGKVKTLIRSEGKTRTFERENGDIIERSEGSISWRNNNPGNLKFEHAGSADETVRSTRTKAKALAAAQRNYDGVVGLDQWGNAVFESYEAGRAAKIQLLRRNHGERTVEEMLKSYTTPDYSGAVNHRAQADFIYQQGDRQGVELRNKVLGAMTDVELAALADGIKGYEGWRVGETRHVTTRDMTNVAHAAHALRDPLPSNSLYFEAQMHFMGAGKHYEYGRPDLPKPGRDPSRLERDRDGDGKLGVDCSAFVWRGLKNAGFDVQGETAAAFTTRTLFNGSNVTSYARQHFDVISASDARRPAGELEPGDILMFSGKSSQHVGIFKGYDSQGRIQYIGSQGSTGPREVTIVPGGYWDGRATHIVGALRAKPEFQVREPLHADQTIAARGLTPAPHRSAPAPTPFVPPDLGDATVKALQRDLNQLGMKGVDGQPLAVDGEYGKHTRHAVAAFQREQGLSGTGIADNITLGAVNAYVIVADPQRHRALRETYGPPIMPQATTHTVPGQRPMAWQSASAEQPVALRPFSDARHPQHALYEDVRERLAAKGQHFPEDRLTQITAVLHSANFKAGWEGRIDVKDDKVYAQNYQSFTRSGVIVPLDKPAPSTQASMEDVQRQDQAKEEERHEVLVQQQQQAREQGPQGPAMH